MIDLCWCSGETIALRVVERSALVFLKSLCFGGNVFPLQNQLIHLWWAYWLLQVTGSHFSPALLVLLPTVGFASAVVFGLPPWLQSSRCPKQTSRYTGLNCGDKANRKAKQSKGKQFYFVRYFLSLSFTRGDKWNLGQGREMNLNLLFKCI